MQRESTVHCRLDERHGKTYTTSWTQQPTLNDSLAHYGPCAWIQAYRPMAELQSAR